MMKRSLAVIAVLAVPALAQTIPGIPDDLIPGIDIGDLTPDNWSDWATKFGDKVADWTENDLKQIVESADKLAEVSKDWGKEQWDALVGKLPLDEAAMLGQDILDAMPTEDLKALMDKLKKTTLADVEGWTLDTWQKAKTDSLANFDWKPLTKIPDEVIAGWNAVDLKKFDASAITKFTGSQFSKIDADALKDAAADFWKDMPSFQVEALTPEQITAMKDTILSKIPAVDVSFLDADQWKNINLASLADIPRTHIENIDTSVIESWTKDQWAKVPWDSIKDFADEQVAKIPTTELNTWSLDKLKEFPMSESINFSKEQLDAMAEHLKQMTAEELGKFDMGALKASVGYADLEEGIKTAVEGMKHDWQAELKALQDELKALKAKLLDEKKAHDAVVSDPASTDEQIVAAEQSYAVAKQAEAASAAEVTVVKNQIDGIEENSASATGATAVTLLLAAVAIMY